MGESELAPGLETRSTKRRRGCFLYYRSAARSEQGAVTLAEKSTFALRVRAAKPRATKYEVRDDVVTGLALTIQPTGVRSYFLSCMVRGPGRCSTLALSICVQRSPNAMTRT